MNLRELDHFYMSLDEPVQSCMLSLRDVITQCHPAITQEWKYRLPFFYLHGKMLCYLWIDKKTGYPYIGFTDGGKMDHPLLIQGDRKRMKILMVNPEEDIDVELVKSMLQLALEVRDI